MLDRARAIRAGLGANGRVPHGHDVCPVHATPDGSTVGRSGCTCRLFVFHRRSTFLGLAVLSMILLGSRDAPAHANVLDAIPADGSVLTHAPERVVVRFASSIESRSTKISLAGPTGNSSLTIEGSGGRPMQELSIPVPDQGRGRYLVRWEVVAMDGERFGGKIRFVVKK